MQIYLLRSGELRMKVLPRKISGQQVLEYTTQNGESKPLVRINARDDRWFLCENRHVEISNSQKRDDNRYGEVELIPNALHYLRLDKQETIVLMVEPDQEDRRCYTHFLVPSDGIIEIGRGYGNHICYNHPFVNDACHIRIRYKRDGTILVEDCQGVFSAGEKNPAYVDSQCLIDSVEAKCGSVIFLFGLKIVLGKDFIALNNPDYRISSRLTSRNHLPFTPAEEEEENETEEQFFSSAPRNRKEVIHREFKIENPPEDLKAPDTPWIVMLGPSITMAMGSVFSSVITMNNILANNGNISTAMPSLVTSVVMVLGSTVWPIIGRRVQRRSQVRKAAIASEDYEIYLRKLKKDIDAAVAQQKAITEENNPTLNSCIETILNVSSDLWERSNRHKDFLDVMIGRGNIELDADFSYQERSYHSEISKSARAMYNLVRKKPLVEDVPITLPLKDSGIVGVVGDRVSEISFCKALLIELTAMHNYQDLKIIVIYNEKEKKDWEFVKWIPHIWNDERSLRYLANNPDTVRNLSDYISNLIEVKKSRHGKEEKGPHYIILALDKALAEKASAIKDFYSEQNIEGMTLISVYDERSRLPKACSYVIDLISEADRERDPERYKDVKATLADYNDITGTRQVCKEFISYGNDPEEIFVHMSNVKLDTTDEAGQLPTQYTFMEMMGIGKPEHLDLARRWKEHNAVQSLATPIGIDADGYYINLDIHEKAHGPHGVIAGMTGSGKSEFIIAYIASLAINYSPEDVAFVLIDFKGGGMADVFKHLPHTAGLITNLDGNELRRSFLAIEKELEKRQKLFKEISEQKKISNIDIYKYQKLRLEDPSLKPLPHLVLISDEFAELKQQHREFMEQLIRIARIGRSLGVHLVLATQKPDGVVDDQIKSNIRFKVCLKVQDKADSQSMIDRPDATLITNSGRFYFLVGNNEVFEYGQSPWSGATYEPQDHAYKNSYDYIEILNDQGMVLFKESVPKAKRPDGIPEKQIDALVEFIGKTAKESNIQAEKLWLNPLTPPKYEEKKKDIYDTTIQPFVLNPTIGMYDDLMNQRHMPITVPFTEEGNALLYGAAGSGKLDFLNKMLISIMREHGPDEVNFYIADYDSGSLEAFADSCYTRQFVGAGDRNGMESMFEVIAMEVAERQEIMRRYGGSYKSYIKSSGKTLPNLLLLVHNYMNLADTYPDARQRLIQFAREGSKYGIYVMITGTVGNAIPYSLLPLFKNIYTLRQNSDDQYREILGKTEGMVPDAFRGRGLVRVNNNVCEFQTELVFEDAENVYEAIQKFCVEKNKEYQNDTVQKLVTAEPVRKAKLFGSELTETKTGLTVNRKEQDVVEEETTEYNGIPQTVPEGRDNRIPVCQIGTEKYTGNPAAIDLQAQTATMILYDDLHYKQAEIIRKITKEAAPLFLELRASDSDIEKKIEDLWNEMLRRANAAVQAKSEGLETPDFPVLMVQVKSPAEIVDTVTSACRVHLVSMIQKLTPGYHIFFVILETANNCFAVMQGKCLSPAIPFAQGILLTEDTMARELFSENVKFTGSARRPYAYRIQDEEAELISILQE